ncbi:MAG: GPR endopeptidase [Eubacteriaceae bacterium]|jgi:spore protease|nr:GPR endopeptidase [Eubacteriaceae bacterium]
MRQSDVLSDFASEIGQGDMFKAHSFESVSVDEITISSEASKILAKPKGRYFVLTFQRQSLDRKHLSEAMHKCVSSLISFKEGEKAMVIGLGNDSLVADSFGTSTARLIATSVGSVISISPGVEGTTGLDSGAFVGIVANYASPDAIVMLDSLYSNAPERMLECIQISNAPLSAGSGLDKKRDSLEKLPKAKAILSIGYTTTAGMDLKHVPAKSGTDSAQYSRHDTAVITPADCDHYVRVISEIAADVLNKSLAPIGGKTS